MKRLTIICLLLGLFLTIGCNQDDEIGFTPNGSEEEIIHKDASYFPLKLGNRWVYNQRVSFISSAGNFGKTKAYLDKTVVGDTLVGENKYFKIKVVKKTYERNDTEVDQTFIYFEFYRIDENANLHDYTKHERYIDRYTFGHEINLCDLSEEEIDDEQYLGILETKDTSYFGLATTFKKYRLALSLYDEEVMDFINNIGPLLYEWKNDQFYETTILIAAEIDRKVYGDSSVFETIFPPEGTIILEAPYAPTTKTVELKWNKVETDDVKSYELYRKDTDDFETDKGELILKTEDLSQISFIDENVIHDQDYFYKIYTVDQNNNEVKSSKVIEQRLVREKVFEGNPDLYTQSLLDRFGKQQYTKVNGDVWIHDDRFVSDRIVNFLSLNTITEVTGRLILGAREDEPGPVDPESRCCIRKITDFSGLENLVSIGGNLEIDGVAFIESFKEFNNLKEIGGNLEVSNTPYLKNFDGLQKLTSIGGDLMIATDFVILPIVISPQIPPSDPLLESLNGLSNVSTIDGDTRITDNTNLTNFCALKNASFNAEYQVSDNGYNPTVEQIKSDEFCLQN